MTEFLLSALWGGVAAAGFAILFNVPVRTLLGCALGGAVAVVLRSLLLHNGASLPQATFVAATVVGFASVLMGRVWHAPAIVFVVPGVIPLIPGALAFSAMMDILRLASAGPQADVLQLGTTTARTLQTLLTFMALAGGVALPSLLLRRKLPMT